MANGETNGNTIKLNTAILIWLGGLTICGAFYAGVSLERLNNIIAVQSESKKEIDNKIELIRLKTDNNESNLKALTLSYTRGEQTEFTKPRKNGGQ